MSKFLKEGDVIELVPGMKVYANVSEKYIYSNSIRDKKVHAAVVVGKHYVFTGTALDIIAKDYASDIVNRGKEVDILIPLKEATALVRKYAPVATIDTFVLEPGEYVVTSTSYDGGSSGGGMSGHDSYPNGHHVFCTKVKERDPLLITNIDFYQSGCFSAMVENITPVRKLKLIWKEV